jgi:hypothetical protein
MKGGRLNEPFSNSDFRIACPEFKRGHTMHFCGSTEKQITRVKVEKGIFARDDSWETVRVVEINLEKKTGE